MKASRCSTAFPKAPTGRVVGHPNPPKTVYLIRSYCQPTHFPHLTRARSVFLGRNDRQRDIVLNLRPKMKMVEPSEDLR